ncbi:UNVERIFIED_CONTAM: hypothetical protein GTU68_057482 [Idotea baltica]|nr:hypothetical protein [Idotea baltica]
MAKELGFEITLEDNEELKGVSRMRCLDIILAKGGIELDEERKLELATEKNEWYLELVSEMNADDVLPGVRRFLEYLVGRNVPIGVASASRNARTILKQTDLERYFNTIVDGTRTVKAKPDPEVFLTCAQELNTPPEQCAVFEDAVAGVQGALAGKMMAIGIGHPAILKEADLVFPGIFAVEPKDFPFPK